MPGTGGVRTLFTLGSLALSLVGCTREPQCNSTIDPSTVVTVTDETTGQPVCGATVQAWRSLDDAMVGQTTFMAGAGEAGCSGEYTGFLLNTGPWTVEVDKTGYATTIATVNGPAPIDCNAVQGPIQSQEISVVLSPQP